MRKVENTQACETIWESERHRPYLLLQELDPTEPTVLSPQIEKLEDTHAKTANLVRKNPQIQAPKLPRAGCLKPLVLKCLYGVMGCQGRLEGKMKDNGVVEKKRGG